MNGKKRSDRRERAHASIWARGGDDRGFTLVELAVVVAVVAILIAVLFPRMNGLVSGARRSEVRRDAQHISAAIELMKIEGVYDPDDTRLGDRIRESAGRDFEGRVTELKTDGGFTYTRQVGGESYSVTYDAATADFTDTVPRDNGGG
ncbi:MAG: prepilin-type N-terminal cleavage/methylation domain-containing protein [Clostridiales bacterium]|jgi:prepilin-type N-terminal cleavage/methylation domain-containing protein|nr:prepilin-type N-terminal cleavage/methylation domain-containing protein [Clostridiales bacterium]